MIRKSIQPARTELQPVRRPGVPDHHPRPPQLATAEELEMAGGGGRSPLRRLVIAGFTTIIVSFGGFLGWAFFADLSSASVASGTVVVDSKRKTVSHFEGGVLSRVMIQEGDQVTAGQLLIKLEDTRARADLQGLESRRIGLIAKLARLRAEQAGTQAIGFPDELSGDDVAVSDAMAAERAYFETRRASKNGRSSIQLATIEEFAERSKFLTIQIEAVDRQISLINEQRTAIATLVEKGFAQRARLIEIDTRLSQLAASRGELAGQRAQAVKAKGGAELGLTGIDRDFQSEIAGEITTSRLELADVIERIIGAKDVLRRLEIRSPQEGIVTNIRVRTPGSAVTPGEPLLDIVPESEPLLVEMHVGTRDVDSITVGSQAQIRLTAFNQRSHLPVAGKITYVAADQSIDEKSNVAYFVARAQVDPASLAANPDMRLYPGMPAEVLIVHKSRRAIDYLISPVTDSFNRAFRED